MNELREKFEGVAEIKIYLKHGHVFFDENKNTYASEFQALHFVSCYVNGAWMAFQEQQKKIDAVLSRIAEQQADYGQPAWVYLEEIKELLK